MKTVKQGLSNRNGAKQIINFSSSRLFSTFYPRKKNTQSFISFFSAFEIELQRYKTWIQRRFLTPKQTQLSPSLSLSLSPHPHCLLLSSLLPLTRTRNLGAEMHGKMKNLKIDVKSDTRKNNSIQTRSVFCGGGWRVAKGVDFMVYDLHDIFRSRSGWERIM